jgi:hypothetical protein
MHNVLKTDKDRHGANLSPVFLCIAIAPDSIFIAEKSIISWIASAICLTIPIYRGQRLIIA